MYVHMYITNLLHAFMHGKLSPFYGWLSAVYMYVIAHVLKNYVSTNILTIFFIYGQVLLPTTSGPAPWEPSTI